MASSWDLLVEKVFLSSLAYAVVVVVKWYIPILSSFPQNSMEAVVRDCITIVFVYVFYKIMNFFKTKAVRITLHRAPKEINLDKLKTGEDVPRSPVNGEQEFSFEDTWAFKNNNLDYNIDDCTNHRKVCVIGRFKVGKTTLLNMMGISNAIGDPLKNTKGVIFYKQDNVLYLDSEGFEQTIDVQDPELRMNLILNFLKRCGDVIIIVMPMMSINDRKLMLRIVEFMKDLKFKIIIVHNLKTLIAREDIELYSKNLSSYLTSQNLKIFTSQSEANFEMNINGIVINHFFLGDTEKLDEFNRSQVEKIKSFGDSRRCVSIKDSFKEALESTYFWIYNIKSNLKVIENEAKDYCVSGTTYGIREVKWGDQILVGYTLHYRWSTPFRYKKGYYCELIINPVTIDLDSLKIQLQDQRVIILEYTTKKYSKHDEDIITLPNQREVISTPLPIVATGEAIEAAMAEKQIRETGELTFMFQLQESDELKSIKI